MTHMVKPIIVTTAVLWAALAHAATDDQKCLAKRNKAAGKYAACIQNVTAKVYATDSIFNLEDVQKLTKCRIKYVATWDKLGKLSGSSLCSGPRFVASGTHVLDNLTGLTWEKKTTVPGSGANAADRNDVDNGYTFSSADGDLTDEDGTIFTDYLANLNSSGFGGANGWRLPSLGELLSVLLPEELPCNTSPCISATFGPTWGASYMAQTPRADDTTQSFLVDFDDGAINTITRGLPAHFVRAVRGGL